MSELRDLPQVDRLTRHPRLAELPPVIRARVARRTIDLAREQIVSEGSSDLESLLDLIASEAERQTHGPKRAINLSGVILHTGLGRARLAPSAVDAMNIAARDHCLLELDEESGERGDRQSYLREMLRALTGAADALAVNNAAGALSLTLSALASGKEVLLARGQWVQIGGSFRVPDIVKASGARLVDVGCTNQVNLGDYRIGRRTGAILVCHRSNFEISGFASEPSLDELAKLPVPVIHDQGTGCLIDMRPHGLPHITTMRESIESGVAVCLGSGDKLLGGPQAGIIVGKTEILEKIRNHPLARAFRVDKSTVAGLAATLRLYLDGRELEIPTVKYLARSSEEVQHMARLLADRITCECVVEPSQSEVGGGAGHGLNVDTYRVGLAGRKAIEIAKRLRYAETAIIGRIESGTLWLDPRAAEVDELDMAAEEINRCLI